MSPVLTEELHLLSDGWTESPVDVLRSGAGVQLDARLSPSETEALGAVCLLGTVLLGLPSLPGGC